MKCLAINAPEIESNLKNDVEKSNCQIANKILKLCGASEEVTVEQNHTFRSQRWKHPTNISKVKKS